jgi:hypothetical protein
MFLLTVQLIFFVMTTNQMHHLSLIYFVNQSLRVSGMFIAHHQEIFTVFVQQLVCAVRLIWLAIDQVVGLIPDGVIHHPPHRDNVTAPDGRPNLISRLHFGHNQEGDHEVHKGHVVVLGNNNM